MNDLRSKEQLLRLRGAPVPFSQLQAPAPNANTVSIANAFGQGPPMASIATLPVVNSSVFTDTIQCGSLIYPSESVPDGDYAWNVSSNECTLVPISAPPSAVPTYASAFLNDLTGTYGWNASSANIPFASGSLSSSDIIVGAGGTQFTLNTLGYYQVIVSGSVASQSAGAQVVSTVFLTNGTPYQQLSTAIAAGAVGTINNGTVIQATSPTVLSVNFTGIAGQGVFTSFYISIVKL